MQFQGWEPIATGIFIAVLGFFIKKWIESLECKVDKLCQDINSKMGKKEFFTFKKEADQHHTDIWERINKHSHTEDGKVVIR